VSKPRISAKASTSDCPVRRFKGGASEAFALNSRAKRRFGYGNMRGLLEQSGSTRLKGAAAGGSPTGKLGLDLGFDVNDDGHERPPFLFSYGLYRLNYEKTSLTTSPANTVGRSF
jgi:hypothetical protein